jgi:hypothetical protein
MAIGSVTALIALGIAAFIPGLRRRPDAAVTENRHGEAVVTATR